MNSEIISENEILNKDLLAVFSKVNCQSRNNTPMCSDQFGLFVVRNFSQGIKAKVHKGSYSGKRKK